MFWRFAPKQLLLLAILNIKIKIQYLKHLKSADNLKFDKKCQFQSQLSSISIKMCFCFGISAFLHFFVKMKNTVQIQNQFHLQIQCIKLTITITKRLLPFNCNTLYFQPFSILILVERSKYFKITTGN